MMKAVQIFLGLVIFSILLRVFVDFLNVYVLPIKINEEIMVKQPLSSFQMEGGNLSVGNFNENKRNKCMASPLIKEYVTKHRNTMLNLRKNKNYFYEPHTSDSLLIYIGFPPPPRVGRHGGLADRFTGLITLFAISMATNTSFVVDWPELEMAFSASPWLTSLQNNENDNVNNSDFVFGSVYNLSREYASDYFQSLLAPSKFSSKEAKSLHYYFRYPIQYGRGSELVNILNDKTTGKSHGNVYFARAVHGNIGRLLKSNKFFHQRFVHYGKLNIDEIYGCLFDLLFQLRVEALSANLKQIYTELVTTTNKEKILLQIRTGDFAIAQSEKYLQVKDEEIGSLSFPVSNLNFITCALSLEGDLPRKGDTVWYVMSDNILLKRYIQMKYQTQERRVLTNVGLTTHANNLFNTVEKNKIGFVNSAAEWWLAGLCDYFIVTSMSGLGQQAAFRSTRVGGRVFKMTIIFDQGTGKETVQIAPVNSCLKGDAIQDAHALSYSYSEIRRR